MEKSQYKCKFVVDVSNKIDFFFFNWHNTFLFSIGEIFDAKWQQMLDHTLFFPTKGMGLWIR